MTRPIISTSKHEYSPSCSCEACIDTFLQRLRSRRALQYGYVERPRMRWRGILAALAFMLIALALAGLIVFLAFSDQATAREGAIHPVIRPAGLLQAKRLCSDTTPKVECRAQLRLVLGALAWQKQARRHLERRLADFQQPVDHLAAWTCIHQHEGAWNDTGDPYWGGLQMDSSFMRTYGPDMIQKYGGWAHLWSPKDQMIVAERAYDAGRGFAPWPNTRLMCGV